MNVPELIRRAIEIGERNGKITFDELNQLCGSELDPEDIERILNALSEAGIWLEAE
ncbi:MULTISPECIES: RNA polymerase sigma factor region1.1 domain-containing protein [unclassified Bradyrhizobium]|uniref:RNA polymerase sigma factor region1.1 domain-containing protein n=1 Tax=unclassified Bradyrhizobium TaxID=2631580 RepID=UPI0024788A39|nr:MULTISPECIES: RNA polymerase sigma factor region1.1 domain-containing protein [unclassified Bradyrhizobium]WGS17384.1 RNA polymerase subunit sigma-70 [Bradyrhizobium sp. ISRA463]WGS24154.1 RNA polymerase subunit sigma-70 [Bradyrhizobium sp. ISRA464]